ncbi:hypothetical protein GO986_16330 [Deinococcus sp. HMF7620]|uniref:Uncharacterized protein n=1 Tax=Deinococcus arboris TaxID=2682977 RepID=A0A7C9HT52_9DEIO|nr:hypothetical protein [Deinococcus arboris]MVN88314.1 hypothetical protein [Deinococcus arboris]
MTVANTRGITFGDHMVRALLTGKKTVTRRLLTVQPPTLPEDGYAYPHYWGAVGTYSGVDEPRHFWTNRPPEADNFEDEAAAQEAFEDETLFWPGEDPHSISPADEGVYGPGGLESPFGSERNCIKPAARLYVREAWRVGSWDEGVIAVDYRADGHARREWLPLPDDQWLRLAHQSADDCEKAGLTMDGKGRYHWPMGEAPTRWRLPRYMPRVASRLTLEVTDVWPERLHAMTEDEAISEGMTSLPDEWLAKHWPDWWAEHERVQIRNALLEADGIRFGLEPMPIGPSPLERFRALWGELHTALGTDWDSNPWVWRVGVRVVTP